MGVTKTVPQRWRRWRCPFYPPGRVPLRTLVPVDLLEEVDRWAERHGVDMPTALGDLVCLAIPAELAEVATTVITEALDREARASHIGPAVLAAAERGDLDLWNTEQGTAARWAVYQARYRRDVAAYCAQPTEPSEPSQHPEPSEPAA